MTWTLKALSPTRSVSKSSGITPRLQTPNRDTATFKSSPLRRSLETASFRWASPGTCHSPSQATCRDRWLRFAADPSPAISDGLCSNICHQGTVLQATAYAVPFIAAVAAGDVPDGIRAPLLALLGDISIGGSYVAPDRSHAGALETT